MEKQALPKSEKNIKKKKKIKAIHLYIHFINKVFLNRHISRTRATISKRFSDTCMDQQALSEHEEKLWKEEKNQYLTFLCRFHKKKFSMNSRISETRYTRSLKRFKIFALTNKPTRTRKKWWNKLKIFKSILFLSVS